METHISIIIPVYNTEQFLHQCIDSVLHQPYTNLEVILVNDGSTDTSGSICDDYAEIDKRIKVIHQENRGLSEARNAGVAIATGKYLMFLDSDDYYVEDDFLSRLSLQVQDNSPDVVLYGFKKFSQADRTIYEDSFIGDRNLILYNSKESSFEYLIIHNLYRSSACNKLIKRSLLGEHKITFRKGVLSEDIEFSALVALAAKKIDYFPENIYVYRQREGSITKTIKVKNIVDVIDNIDHCITAIKGQEETQFYPSYMAYVAYQYSALLKDSHMLKKEQRKELLPLITNKKFLLKFGKDKKTKLIHLFYKLLGFNGMYHVMGLYNSLHS